MNNYYIYGDNKEQILIYLTMPMEQEAYGAIYKQAVEDTSPFTMVVYEIESTQWNNNLSPWPYKEEKGRMQFGGQAQVLLETLQQELIPKLDLQEGAKISLAGYSLAGLFALWAVKQGSFAGAISCSGSIWYPGFLDWMKEHSFAHSVRIYLSLGDKEEKTRNPLMAAVGDATRDLAKLFEEDQKISMSTLEWNPGNHFANPSERMLRGIKWYYRK